jgi:hypothetical protein
MMKTPVWEQGEDKARFRRAIRKLQSSDINIATCGPAQRRDALLEYVKLLDAHFSSGAEMWHATEEHLKARGDFYGGMPASAFVKSADRHGFEAIALFNSPICDHTLALARARDARLMLATITQNAVYEVEIHGWLKGSCGDGVAFELKRFRHLLGRSNRMSKWQCLRPVEHIGSALRLEDVDTLRAPIRQWWSSGSGSEQALSWHHNLFTRSEIDYMQYNGRPLETRHHAIPDPWRDIFDLDGKRFHYIEVPEMEAALRAMIP